MAITLLTTKFYIPTARSEIVRRTQLIKQLNDGLNRKLSLISGPAGFGKTTLVTEWLANLEIDTYNGAVAENKVAWLSLDEGDNDQARFLMYFISSLNQIKGINPAFGKVALSMLHSPDPPPPDAILTSLINEFAEIPDKIILVLDDYHVIDSKPVDENLCFLLEHMPPQLHLVITTREDPDLPLARLRARDQLTELRAADLRFTSSETAEFLNRVMSLELSAEDIDALEARTEGWVAGLQLAALSMQGHSDTSSFIRSFIGSHRFVLDYLAGEVLERQPERVRNFLLQTAILDRLSGSLCDAVTAQEGGRGMLESLERGNLFVVPLDDQGQWYRYHQLFADVLQAHLKETQPEQVSCLQQRASEWYEQNGFPSDAIRHALAAEDFERAAGLIELAWSAMDRSYQSSTWLGWVKALPEVLVQARPVLSVGYAWALLDGGELEASEVRLHDAECLLDTPTDKMVVVDKELFRSLPASIATARAYRSLALGNVPNTVKYAQRALELTPEDDWVRYIQATSLLGLAQYTSGDLPAAERSLANFHMNLRKSGEIQTLIGITFLLADIRAALGRLHEAESIYQQSIRIATNQGEPMPLGSADLYRGLAELYIERGDLETSAQHLQTSQILGVQVATTDWLHRLYVSQARLNEAQGDLDGALALLDEAERVYIRGPLPDVRPTAALKTQVWLKQGRLAEALGWAREQELSVDDEICYRREFEHITLARVLIAAGKSDRGAGSLDEAIQLLGRLLEAAETGGRLGSAIQILLLQALAFQAQDNLPHALAPLERALVLAEPEGYVRIFVDEGEEMQSLIKKQSRNRDHQLSGYIDKLLAAFSQPAAGPKSGIMHQKTNLLEPLSERELEVLKLLRSESSGPEIAQQLIVSLNTFRSHTKNIYKKLGVNNRRAAVRRAEDLDLF